MRALGANGAASAGDAVVVRALTDSATYNMLELPTGRLAKINPGDLLIGVLGRRRALKGFVGDVPATLASGDQLEFECEIDNTAGNSASAVGSENCGSERPCARARARQTQTAVLACRAFIG